MRVLLDVISGYKDAGADLRRKRACQLRFDRCAIEHAPGCDKYDPAARRLFVPCPVDGDRNTPACCLENAACIRSLGQMQYAFDAVDAIGQARKQRMELPDQHRLLPFDHEAFKCLLRETRSRIGGLAYEASGKVCTGNAQ